jgi:RHS repeat-associated protein
LMDEYKYDEFGMLTNVDEKSNINNPFKYTGAIHDKTANLYLMGSRYYNPKVGRFITQDSYGASYGADWTDHLYSYTNNNPVNFIDPTGHIYLSANASRNSMQDTLNVQNMLIQLNILKNYSPGGKYDSKTVQAVNTFKNRYGLGNSGKYKGAVGDQTYEYLLKATSGKLITPSGRQVTGQVKKNTTTTTNNNTNNIKSETFYAETGGIKLKANDKGDKSLQLAKNEIGLGKSTATYQYGQIEVKAPNANANANLSWEQGSVGAKASMADVGGTVFIPVWNNHRIDIGGSVSFISAGAKFSYNFVEGYGKGYLGVGPMGFELSLAVK